VRTHTRRSRVARIWAALAALVVVPATIALTTTAAGAAGSNTLTVKAGEYTYLLKGSPKAGWTQITFDNAGVEDHMMAMFKLKPGTTSAQLKTAILSSDQNALQKVVTAPIDGAPSLLSAGAKTTTMTKLAAGTYGIACFIPAPSDGKTHAEHGMYKVFKVSGKSSATPPTDGVTNVSIDDSGITVPSSGIPAHGWLKVTNNSSVGRDATFAKYATSDATFDQANAYYNEYFSTNKLPAGPAPATLDGGLGNLQKGGTGYVEADFQSGRYVLVSSNQDVDGNDPSPLHLDFTIG
jgi:hypothetical protein